MSAIGRRSAERIRKEEETRRDLAVASHDARKKLAAASRDAAKTPPKTDIEPVEVLQTTI